jgi:ribosomal protein S6
MENEKDKKNYELAYLAKNEEAAHEVSEMVKSVGAEVSFEAPLTKLPLAYPVKKEKAAHFGYMHFISDPGLIADLDRSLKTLPSVLRFLIITPPFVKSQGRSERPASSGSAPRAKFATPRMSQPKPTPLSNEALEKKIEEILK